MNKLYSSKVRLPKLV